MVTGRSIKRFDQDGNNAKVLYDNQSIYIYAMALDYVNQDIYWIERKFYGLSRIRYVNVNDGEVKTFKVDGSLEVRLDDKHLAVDHSHVYFVRFGHLLRVSKADGAYDEKFDVIQNGDGHYRAQFGNILIFGVQRIAEDHPCKNENGGCEAVCVAVRSEDSKLTGKCIENNFGVSTEDPPWWKKIIG